MEAPYSGPAAGPEERRSIGNIDTSVRNGFRRAVSARARRGRHARVHAFRDGTSKLVGLISAPAGGLKTKLYRRKGRNSANFASQSWPKPVSRRAIGRGWEACFGSAPRSSTAGTRRPRRLTASVGRAAIPSTTPASLGATPTLYSATTHTLFSAWSPRSAHQGAAVHSFSGHPYRHDHRKNRGARQKNRTISGP